MSPLCPSQLPARLGPNQVVQVPGRLHHFLFEMMRSAKVADLALALGIDQYVLGFEVTMHDVALVQVFESRDNVM